MWILLGLLSIVNLLMVESGTCTITSEDWTTILTALKSRNYYEIFEKGGYCNASSPNSFIQKYGSCTATLENALVTQGIENNCRQVLNSNLYSGTEQTSANILTRAIDICSGHNLGDTITLHYFCNALSVVGCPRQLDILKFAIFDVCHRTALINKTLAEKEEYFEKGLDKVCMINNKACTEVFIDWKTCPIIVNTLLDFIDVGKVYTCASEFPTVEERCNATFQTEYELYCPPKTIVEQYFYAIVVSCTAGPIFLLFAFLLYKRIYRAHHISKDEIILQAQAVHENTGSLQLLHPELAAVVASKYKGVTFDPSTGRWFVTGAAGRKQTFDDEQDAARFAYINLAGLHSSINKASPKGSDSSYSAIQPFTSIEMNSPAYVQEEYVVTAIPPTAEEIKQRRLKQLISFYEYWEPNKTDIPGHAENLLNRHDFDHVARAVKTKYGVLPLGWSEELDV